MAFSALPPQLQLHVAGYLDPESCLHLAITCRDHHNLCRSVLREHGRRFSEGQTLDTADSTVASRLLWSTLKEVLNDPSKGWYVRELNLPSSRGYHWDMANLGTKAPNSLAVPPEGDQKLFKKAARALEGLYPNLQIDSNKIDEPHFGYGEKPNNLIATLEERIAAGFDDAIIAILLHHLPYLKTIRITDVESDALLLTMRRISAAYNDSSETRRLPLRRLTAAAVAHWDAEMCCNADWACYFLCLPSLQSFAAHAMGDSPDLGGGEGYLLRDGAPLSDITELFLRNCQFDVEGLEVILAGLRSLKRLTYTGGGATVSESAMYEPHGVIAAIANNVGHSLEELELAQDSLGAEMSEEDDLETASLREFKKLKRLDCEWKMLLPLHVHSDVDEPMEEGFQQDGNEASAEFDVRTVLPESLQELYLHGTFSDDDWETVSDILASPNAATPNLDRMCIERRAITWPHDTLAVIGNAPVPARVYLNPLAKLLDGHGYL